MKNSREPPMLSEPRTRKHRPPKAILADLEAELVQMTARYEEKKAQLESRIGKLKVKVQIDSLIEQGHSTKYDHLSKEELQLQIKALTELVIRKRGVKKP